MKRIFLLLIIGIALVSCSLETEDGTNFHTELLPIESAILPNEFKRDKVYDLPFTYVKPSTCHIFQGFYYEKVGNIRTIAINTNVVEQAGCTVPTVNPNTEILKFKPSNYESYVFKLWKGTNDSGEDIFEIIEIPVVP